MTAGILVVTLAIVSCYRPPEIPERAADQQSGPRPRQHSAADSRAVIGGANGFLGVSSLTTRMMTTLLKRAALTIVAAALTSAAAWSAQISGHILGDGAKPVAHAVVLLLPDTPATAKPGKAVRVETGEDGGFVAQGLTGESFRVRVEADGYAPLTQPGIPASAVVQLRLRRGVKLSGIVKDLTAQTPIGGATILAWDKDAEAFGEDAYRKAESGKDGRFVVSDLPAGKATVEARASGHAPARSRNVPIPKADLELLLDLPGALTGLVTDTSGDPIAGADVKVSWRDATGAGSRGVKTGASGRYRIADAATTQVTRTTVRAAKFLPVEREGPQPADGVLDFVLERGGTIAGIVRGYDGEFPPSFRVKVEVEVEGEGESSSRLRSEHEFSDPDGAFRVDDLDPGTYTIEVGADRYASATKAELVVVAEQVADAGTLTLPSRSALRGRVVAARDRTPVSGATVKVVLVDDPEHPAAVGAKTSWTETTASEGTFATTELPAGTLDVLVEHPQFVQAKTRISFRPDADTPELTLELSRGGVLTGTVLNGKLDPVPGVRIVAASAAGGDSRIADTGSDGGYFIDGLAPGAYTVTRRQERGGGPAGLDTKPATIREGETTTVDFDEAPRVSVSGVLMKGDVPIPAAAIHFMPAERGSRHLGASTRSDSDGAFQIGLRHGGSYQVSVVFGVTGSANAHNVITLTIPDQPEVRQDIVFDALAVSGHVVNPERTGVQGALVTASREGAPAGGSPRQTTTMTGADGSFRLEAIDPGTYRVTARARGYGAGEAYPVVVRENEPDPELELNLERGWIMRGRLVDPQGRGVPGALAVVAPQGAAESGYLPAQTDGTGRFRITAPADAPVNVAAISPRFAPAVRNDVEQPVDEDTFEVVLQASAGGTLRVRVVHRGGGPVPGAQIAFRPVPLFPGCDVVMERNRPKTTDADGTTFVRLLYPGTYLVSIVGRRDAAAVQVRVDEGIESSVVIEVP